MSTGGVQRAERGAASTPTPPRLYVIPGSHACRTAILMLEHKGLPHRVVELVPGTHPTAVRLLGFSDRTRSRRDVGGRTTPLLAFADWSGTVPALRDGAERVMTNHKIARHLDARQPEPPLLPSDPERRRTVEEIERFGDRELQMAARRAILAAGAAGSLLRDAASGPLGPLLFHNDRVRRLASRLFGGVFAAQPGRERELLDATAPLLDRVDAWVENGDLNGATLTVADFVVAPSVALLTYHPRLAAEIGARPAGRLVARLLPWP
jgi:glutathione S-transferase